MNTFGVDYSETDKANLAIMLSMKAVPVIPDIEECKKCQTFKAHEFEGPDRTPGNCSHWLGNEGQCPKTDS